MRRSDKEVTDRNEIESIISETGLCHLAMADGDQPYVVPLSFGYEDKVLYFHCAHEGRKLEIMAVNPKVCFSLVAAWRNSESPKGCNWGTRYRSVVGTGTASIVTDQAEKERGLKALLRQYSGEDYSFSQEETDSITVIKEDIQQMSGKVST